MQENGTSARQSLFFGMNIDVVTTSHYGRWFSSAFLEKERMIYLIEVSVRKDGIKVTGHSQYDQPGRDVVCAGVTALCQTLVRSIEDLTEDTIEYEISPGRADINYGNLSEKSKTLVDSFFIGSCMIADEFPDHVQII